MITSRDERWSGSYYQVVQDIYSTYLKYRSSVPTSTPSEDGWTIVSAQAGTDSRDIQMLKDGSKCDHLDSPSSSLYTYSSSCAGSTFIHTEEGDFFPSTKLTPLSKALDSLSLSIPSFNHSLDFSHLIAAAIETIESIWSDAESSPNTTLLPATLREYTLQLLSRSRTTFSTLQIALLYLSRLHSRLTALRYFDSTTPELHPDFRDARLTFMTAVILASKYLIDNPPSNAAWSGLSGVHVRRINEMEAAFLGTIRYKLYVSDDTWKQLSGLASFGDQVEGHMGKARFRWSGGSVERWRMEVETRPTADGG
ncbi:hypothetical protein BJ742DRAFT_771924 [Cladochytrium replicatum]|nr:hypothetical protein BJ742DRAFT_771924 [Cladochytrium replicatum]